ncbi:hypothetical protein SLEP1_g13125 [Rubroshorea leprosula]|uniref:Uncharacterized protein n=1 Tax=Rubroshorea leprosula TaxID=152421 RepID=A0AAV5IKJ0_9ROSI|nr:hypothetical protein SLEP1_g13125 [Rubroshorea leprosula]
MECARTRAFNIKTRYKGFIFQLHFLSPLSSILWGPLCFLGPLLSFLRLHLLMLFQSPGSSVGVQVPRCKACNNILGNCPTLSQFAYILGVKEYITCSTLLDFSTLDFGFQFLGKFRNIDYYNRLLS